MESAENIRSHAAVAAFDTTDYIAEYGLLGVNSRALEAARKVVDALAKDAIAAVDEYFAGMKEVGQNPYHDTVATSAIKDARFVAPITVFAENRVVASINTAFTELQSAKPSSAIYDKIEREVAARLKEYGFDVAGVERYRDGTPSRIFLRDPVYAEKAQQLRPGVSLNLELSAALDTLEQKGGDLGVGLHHFVERHQIEDANRWLQDLVDHSVAKVADHMERAVAYGTTPFEAVRGYIKRHRATVVDRSRVRRDIDGDFYVKRRATIHIEPEEAILSRFAKQFGVDTSAYHDNLRKLMRQAVADALKQRPELRAALVTTSEHIWSGSSKDTLTVICGADVIRRAPVRWWLKLWSFVKPTPLLALPPPAAKPAALPAPKPIVVPPLDPQLAARAFQTEVPK